MRLKIGYLYPEYMNIYGDTGNIICLMHRARIREIEIELIPISKNADLQSGEIDIYFFGGGQDQQQGYVSKDLQRLKTAISDDIHNGAVALTICGGYQLFGNFYKPFDGPDLQGLEIFPIETHASHTRMINNLVVQTSPALQNDIQNIYTAPVNIPSTLVGFENHSGQTTFIKEANSLGTVLYGYGNNESRKFEGCRVNNAFGTYMHGSLLPKNPHFADYLVYLAIRYRYEEERKFAPLPDEFAIKAHQYIVKRYSH